MIQYKNGETDTRDIISYNVNNMGNLIVTVWDSVAGKPETLQIGTMEPYWASDPCSEIIGQRYSDFLVHIDDSTNTIGHDALLEMVSNYEHVQRIGQDGYSAKIGDTVEVVKGRKYQKGTKMVVTGFSEWSPEGCYGHNTTYYINFDGGRISKDNVIIL